MGRDYHQPNHLQKPSRRSLVGPLGWSVLLHLLLLVVVAPFWSEITRIDQKTSITPVTLLLEEPEEPVEVPTPEEQPSGQIVDIAPPQEEEKPDEAEYLAEHDQVVDEETRTKEFRINPEVLARQYHADDQLQFEELFDLNITEPSTGAQIGNDRFDPDENGTLASLPSPFQLTNKDGLQRPVPASSSSQSLAGAPNNDLLDEQIGESVNLNTKELLGANYFNRIRRLVNFYWKQNIDNLPSSVRFAKSRYKTVVYVVLNDRGVLHVVDVTADSGSPPLDKAVVDAFRIAGPYPNPPEQLVNEQGQVILPDFAFTVELGHAKAIYQGVDPRQGVQFPGIMKATR